MSGHDDFEDLRVGLAAEVDRDPCRRARWRQRRAAYDLIVALTGLQASLAAIQDELTESLDFDGGRLPRLAGDHDRYVSTLRRYVETLSSRGLGGGPLPPGARP